MPKAGYVYILASVNGRVKRKTAPSDWGRGHL